MRPGFGRTHTRGDLWAYHDASVPIDPPPDADGSNSEQHGHSGASSIVQGRRHGLSIPALVIAASAIGALGLDGECLALQKPRPPGSFSTERDRHLIPSAPSAC
jgi:hypothetical protein